MPYRRKLRLQMQRLRLAVGRYRFQPLDLGLGGV
jgi:hypothetical protein